MNARRRHDARPQTTPGGLTVFLVALVFFTAVGLGVLVGLDALLGVLPNSAAGVVMGLALGGLAVVGAHLAVTHYH